MTYPEQTPPQRPVIPGYFGPAEAPYIAQPRNEVPQQPAQQGQYWQMPAPVSPYVIPPISYGTLDPASQPLVGATLLQAVCRFYKKYATFSGRASRSEFWWVQLFFTAVFIMTAMVYSSTNDWVLNAYMVFLFASFVPMLALTVRRLHDTNLRGFWTVLLLVPWAGFLIVVGLAYKSAKPAGSRFDRVLPGTVRQ